jgi:excisionase family DNA binding protein
MRHFAANRGDLRRGGAVCDGLRLTVMIMTELPRLLTTAELARLLHVDRRTVQRWTAAGVIKPTLTMPGGGYRWDADDVRAQLRRGP